jgi:hypothetical protein
MKLEEPIHDIKSGKMFGPCNAGTTTQLSIHNKFYLYFIAFKIADFRTLLML